MPIERSPTATPASETVPFENLEEQPASTRTLNFPIDAFSQQGESREKEINSNEFRLLKLPNFWHKQPKL